MLKCCIFGPVLKFNDIFVPEINCFLDQNRGVRYISSAIIS